MSNSLSIIIGSTRTNRVGRDVAEWISTQAKEHGFDEVELIDLQEINLPKFDVAVPPMYSAVDTPEVKAWAAKISAAQHLLFLTPEYNQSIPADLKAAIDYLSAEWNGKPAAIASYGYMGGGASASRHLRDIIAFVKTDLITESATIQLGDTTVVDGVFTPAGVTPEEVSALQTTLRTLSEK